MPGLIANRTIVRVIRVEIKFRSRHHEIIHESANKFKRARDAPANPFITDILFHLHIYCIVTENRRHGRRPSRRAGARVKVNLFTVPFFRSFMKAEEAASGCIRWMRLKY